MILTMVWGWGAQKAFRKFLVSTTPQKLSLFEQPLLALVQYVVQKLVTRRRSHCPCLIPTKMLGKLEWNVCVWKTYLMQCLLHSIWQLQL